MSILFDLDGTLIDTALDFLVAINTVRATLDLPPLAKTELPALRLAVSQGTQGLLTAGFGSHPKFHTQSNFILSLQEALLTAYARQVGNAARLFPGIEALLDELDQHHIAWGVVTNKESRFSHPLLEKLHLKHRAGCIVSGDTTPTPKPHPAPLFQACRELKIKPSQCVYIGDAERDILAGHRAGMKTIVALFGYIEDIEVAKRWGAHHTVSHAKEIFPWYQTWLSSHERTA